MKITKYIFSIFAVTVWSYGIFQAISFCRYNGHKEFKRASVMVDRNLFFIKTSVEELLSASHLEQGLLSTAYSLQLIVAR